MELLMSFIDIVLHIDKYMLTIVSQYGVWTYLILFCIIFCETGFVVTPFLPGDSLLFATGALCGAGFLNPVYIFILLSVAAIGGDNVNYWIGRWVGPAIFEREKTRFINKKHLERAHAFYEKHGGKTIVIARFVPIIRTFAPFVAGIARMTYIRYIAYSVSGGLFWIGFFIFIGYFFGNLPIIKRNFSVAIYVIIFLSLMPGLIEYLRHRKAQAVSQ